jgi:beta-lactamase superfamily II metal-dependent hydrolase
MPYHGNYYNEVKKLIENARPQFAVITCSDEEQPSQNTIKVLDDSLVSYYLTSNGTVIFTSNGKSMTAQQ